MMTAVNNDPSRPVQCFNQGSHQGWRNGYFFCAIFVSSLGRILSWRESNITGNIIDINIININLKVQVEINIQVNFNVNVNVNTYHDRITLSATLAVLVPSESASTSGTSPLSTTTGAVQPSMQA